MRTRRGATKTGSIRQSVTIKASPREVYEALMDSRAHARFTGARARISRAVGGRFTTYDGYASGTNLELVPGRTIVQAWRAGDWPAGRVSTVRISLSRVGGGTRLAFSQTGVPAGDREAIRRGWIEFYWTPLRAMLEGRRARRERGRA